MKHFFPGYILSQTRQLGERLGPIIAKD